MVKIIFNNKNYNIDESALAPAMAALETHLRSMAGGADPVMLAAGLYQTGAIALYEEQGASAVDGMMVTSWDKLVADGTVHVENGAVYTGFDLDTETNTSAELLTGDLILPNDGSVTSIDNDSFCCLSFLTGIELPNSITTIGDYAFAYCESLASIEIPAGVTEIGQEAFSDCTNLATVTFAENSQLTTIGTGAFFGGAFTSVEIPASVTTIGPGAFSGSLLTNVTFEEGIQLTTIDGFSANGYLTTICIPNGVTSIGTNAFNACRSLMSVIIPESVTAISKMAFHRCESLNNITFEGTTEQWNAISKDSDWDGDGMPATYVQCSDGQVAL